VTGDGQDANDAGGGELPASGRLRAVQGPLHGHEPMPSVRLVREWKGLCAADLLRLELAERLPGQVRSALRHLEAGDLAAADRALPELGARLLPGPGSRRPQRRHRVVALILVVVAVATAACLADWMVG
jgi:hypothetical protein